MDRLITTYRKNDAGADDESYLDSNTILTLMFLRYTWRNRILLKYPRHKLASDGSKFGSGQPIVTPSIMRGEAVAWFSEMEHLGLVEGIKLFKSELVVERNAGNGNRLDVSLPPDLINQLMVTATKIQFRI
jgi:phage tail sheath gpL-like